MNFSLASGDTTVVNIGAIVINSDTGDPFFANDLTIVGPGFTYTTAATPEPLSFCWELLSLG